MASGFGVELTLRRRKKAFERPRRPRIRETSSLDNSPYTLYLAIDSLSDELSRLGGGFGRHDSFAHPDVNGKAREQRWR